MEKKIIKKIPSLTNDVSLIEIDSIRIFYKKYNDFLIDIINTRDEYQIWELGEKYDIAPKLFRDSTNHIVGSIEFKADNFKGQNTNDEELIAVVKLLKKLHGIVTNKELTRFDVLTKWDIYYDAKWVNDDKKLEAKIQKIYFDVKRYLTNFDNYKLCHNDLHKDNILIKKEDKRYQAKFIDYEFSGLNDPYFDLANLIQENNLNEKQIKVVIETYFEDLNFDKKILDMWITFNIIFWYFWAKRCYEITNEAPYEEISKIRLNEFLKNNY